ncbi:hypothetical protein BJ742DRAFT_744072 [Cladochytrium replicatum]|nr:hypothetical protein BJ742DRAFT_744072 [Cladochytrium replicatum]
MDYMAQNNPAVADLWISLLSTDPAIHSHLNSFAVQASSQPVMSPAASLPVSACTSKSSTSSPLHPQIKTGIGSSTSPLFDFGPFGGLDLNKSNDLLPEPMLTPVIVTPPPPEGFNMSEIPWFHDSLLNLGGSTLVPMNFSGVHSLPSPPLGSPSGWQTTVTPGGTAAPQYLVFAMKNPTQESSPAIHALPPSHFSLPAPAATPINLPSPQTHPPIPSILVSEQPDPIAPAADRQTLSPASPTPPPTPRSTRRARYVFPTTPLRTPSPPPRSTSTRANHPRPVEKIFIQWLLSHYKHPYPDRDAKRHLMHRTETDDNQVMHWFDNARRRAVRTKEGERRGDRGAEWRFLKRWVDKKRRAFPELEEEFMRVMVWEH